jgi:integrase
MLAAKRAANLSKVHLSDLESRLGRFADAFQMNIGGISGKLVQAWLDQMNLSGRTKRNNLHAVGALFRFAIRQKYLPKDALEEIKSVQQAKLDDGEIEIISPAEMRELLVTARSELVPWLVIAGFAGLRSAELQRLDGSEVNLAERHIEITAKKAKTAARRLTPITDNLAAWLAPYVKVSGKVTCFDSWWNQLPKLVDEINQLRLKRKQAGKFVWKHNGLRHSFCSYRLASIQNAAQVALEAGNSPTVIFKSYRQLVTPAAAKAWFAIVPPGASKIVPMGAHSAAA